MTEILLEEVAKRYGPTRALDGVSIRFQGGTVHTILGENGSGKSTLVKSLSGVVVPDSGTISVDGSVIETYRPKVMQKAGIETVFQEVLTAPNRSVVENVFLGSEPLFRAGNESDRQEATVVELFAELGFTGIDPRRPIERFPLLVHQLAVIARALVRSPKALILDEATAALGLVERDALLSHITGLTAKGVLVIFVSHRMDEIMEISDVVSVLRSGRLVGDVTRDDLDPTVLLSMMAPESVHE